MRGCIGNRLNGHTDTPCISTSEVFRLYATGYSKGQYDSRMNGTAPFAERYPVIPSKSLFYLVTVTQVFIRNPDLGHFMDDAKEALPAHRKKFRRFSTKAAESLQGLLH